MAFVIFPQMAPYVAAPPICGSANRSLSHTEPVSGTSRRKLENGEQRPAPETDRSRTESLEIADQRPGCASLTRRNFGGFHTPGNHTQRPNWLAGIIRPSRMSSIRPRALTIAVSMASRLCRVCSFLVRCRKMFGARPDRAAADRCIVRTPADPRKARKPPTADSRKAKDPHRSRLR